MKEKGTVYLVGAGPGDVGLLTLRGAELLARADVVVYDALINRDLLRLAPRDAEVIYGGKRSKDHAMPQEELNELLINKAREGETVVRLKGGDPYIFGPGRRGGGDGWRTPGHPLRGGAGDFLDGRGAELRRHPHHAPGPLLQLHGDHGPRRPGQGGVEPGLGADRQNPWHEGGAHGRVAHP